MKAFQFPLEKVLDFRKRQWEAASAELAVLLERRQVLDRQHEEAVDALDLASQALRANTSLAGGRVQQHAFTMESGRRAVQRVRLALEAASVKAEQQRQRCIDAKRQYELLQRLRHTRKLAWQREADREEETLSTDAFLARRIRERATSVVRPKSSPA